MKRIFWLMLLISLTATLVSCDYKDIDRRIFITSIGIDAAPNNKIMITMKGALTREKNTTNSKNFKIFYVTSDSIGTAFRQIKAISALEPDYGHLKTIVFGRDFFQEDYFEETMNFFMKRRDFQKLAFMLVGSPSAKKIMEFQPEGEDIAGSAMFLRFGQGSKSQYSKKAKMSDLYTAIKTPGITPIISIIEIDAEDYRIDKMAVLDKNFKIVDVLQNEESKMFNILRHRIGYGLIHAWDFQNNKLIGANIQNTKVSYDVHKEDKALIIKVSIKMKVSIEEGSVTSSNQEIVIKSIEEQVKKGAVGLINKLQQNKADPLRLEISYWQKNKEYVHTNNWLNEIFPSAVIDVNVDVALGGQGVTD